MYDPTRLYHKRRHLFFLNPNGLVHQTKPFGGTHSDFAKAEKLPAEANDKWCRGFLWRKTNTLYFYVGPYFDWEPVLTQMQERIDHTLLHLRAADGTIIVGGAIPSETQQPWSPKIVFGPVEVFRAIRYDGTVVRHSG